MDKDDKNKKSKIKIYLELLLVFMKIGVMTFGGGYAMIPIIEREVTEKREWLKKEEIIDVIAISESTPGPIGICCAAFVGYQRAKLTGAFFSTLGAVIPSFVIIYLISLFLKRFEEIKFFKYMFFGLRAGVLSLLVKAIISMYKSSPKHILAYLIMAVSFILVTFFSCNVIFIITGAALTGLCAAVIMKKRGKEL